MNQNLKYFLISISTSLIISFIIALSFYLLNFPIPTCIAIIILTFILQNVISILWNSYIDFINIKNQEMINTIQISTLPITLSCAYCKHYNTIPISFSENNSFECSKCKQYNNVFIQFSTTRITTPIITTNNQIDPYNVTDSPISINEFNENNEINTEENTEENTNISQL